MDAKKNSQAKLILMGALLVFVALGATFAWFAANSSARVDSMTIAVETHTMGTGLEGGVEYDVGTWDDYNEEVLTIIPGQVYNFRVKYNCTSGILKLTDLSGSIVSQLEYRVAVNKGASYDIDSDSGVTWSDLTVSGGEAVLSQNLNGHGVYCYYSIRLPGDEVGNGDSNDPTANHDIDFSFKIGGSFN